MERILLWIDVTQKEYSMDYIQCRMSKRTEKGSLKQVAWIPEKFAIEGDYVKLKQEDGWRVDEVGGRQSDYDNNQRSRDYKKQRAASDI